MSNPMKVLLPVEDDGIILTNMTLGFQPLQDAFGLSEISKKITAGLPDGKAGAIVNAGETAIPDVCAHVQYLRTQLKAGNDLNTADEAVRAWVGVMAIIALSEHRLFSLQVQTINMNGGDAMLSVYREALEKEGLLDADKNLRVLSLRGNPIAVMDVPGAGVNTGRCYCYPFSTIDNPEDVMYSVPWFRPGQVDPVTGKRTAHRWADVLGIDPVTTQPYLSDAEQTLFAEWLDALRENGGDASASSVDYAEAVTKVLKRLNTNIVNAAGDLVSVENTFANPKARPQNLDAWRGVLACVGLSKLRGCTITFESYRAKSAEDPYRSVLLQHNRVSEFILVLVNGARVGRLDNNLLIRPLYCVTDKLKTVDIPWYQNGQWVDIVDGVAPGAMDKTERRRLAHWYKAISQDASMAGKVSQQPLVTSAERLENQFGIGVPGAKMSQLDHGMLTNQTPMPAGFTPLLNIFHTVPDLANPLPSVQEMFTDHLVLTMAGLVNNPSKLGLATAAIDNRITLTGGDAYSPTSETFLALLPLRSSFTAMFSKNPDGIDLLEFHMIAEGDTITATIKLNNGGVTVVSQRQYSYHKREILYYEDFPYLAMWPYINADSWNEYYIAWCQDIRSENSSMVLPNPVDWDESPLAPVAPYEDVSTYDNAPDRQWKLLTYKRFPEYVHFKYVDGGNVEVGAIYTNPPHPHSVKDSNLTYFAAIDFGSSNTIVRLMNQDGETVTENGIQPYRVFTNKYVQPLTMEASQFDAFYGEVRDFHEFYWLPFRGNDSMGVGFWERASEATDVLPTVVETYSGASGDHNKAPRYGQLLRSNCNVMSHFMGQKNNPARPGNTLDALGIRSHIKMKARGAAANDLYDGQIAIEMILLECALAAIENNARLSFVLSYPDNKMWKSLQQFWTPAIQNAQEVCSSINFNGPTGLLKTTELYAAHDYATKFAGDAIPQAGYCILDIGGGTSDISLWMGTGAPGSDDDAFWGGLSLKYAGDQLAAESIFSFYRRLSGAADGNMADFRKLWNLEKASPAITEYEKLMEQGFKNLLSLPLNVAANQERVHAEVPLLSTMIVSDLPWSNAVTLQMANVQPFLALLRTKVASVFYVMAEYLYFMGAFDMNMPGMPYVVCMAGNGSAAYQACGGGMETMAVNMLRTIVADRVFKISSPAGYRKTEVVNGMCTKSQRIIATVGQLTPEALRQPPFVQTAGRFQDIQINDYQPMWDAYNYYVETILKNADQLSGQDGFLDVDGATNIYQMLTMTNPENEQLFNGYWNSILTQVFQESAADTPNFIKAQIAAIKLVDKILLINAYK